MSQGLNTGETILLINALLISDQIGSILASGTRGNPRQIKRFLNTLLLRQASADARGFGDDVKLPVLAKLMLAERFNSRVFDQIAIAAAAAPDGICADLAAMEAAARKKTAREPESQPAIQEEVGLRKPAAKSETSSSDGEVSAVLAEWLSSPSTLDWARLNPPLGNVDLRPYLFLAKDRKDFFGAATAFGQITAIAERLLGGRLAVQAEETTLRPLAPPEAAQVFEVLRTRIIASDSFERAPDGVEGMGVLVRAQPSLQTNLLDFLGALPTNRLGAWACSGWGKVLKDPSAVRRFDQLLDVWSKNGNSLLKAAAANTLRTRTQGGR